MKLIFYILFITLVHSCHERLQENTDFQLSISPLIDRNDPEHQKIIEKLKIFLQTKDESMYENDLWKSSDFKKYKYPYLDLYQIESSKHGSDFFKPTLMEIIRTQDPSQRVVKIAFIGHHPETKENQIKAIYNIMSNNIENKIVFSHYIDYAVKNWKKIRAGHIEYRISPLKQENLEEIENQVKEIKHLQSFLSAEPIDITYYSCLDPSEVFRIKGFDYHPSMYISETGGLAEHGDIIYSGNNSEIYTHEIAHIYTNSLFPKINKFLDEGFATYWAGSGQRDYKWHREKFRSFLAQNPDFDFTLHLDPFERLYFESETPIPYLSAALLCEWTFRLYGQTGLLRLLAWEGALWEGLELIGINKENINKELRKVLAQEVVVIKGRREVDI